MIDKQVSKPAGSRHNPYSDPICSHSDLNTSSNFLGHHSWIAHECKAQPLRQDLFNKGANYTALGHSLQAVSHAAIASAYILTFRQSKVQSAASGEKESEHAHQ